MAKIIRSSISGMSGAQIKFLHSILLLVENDDADANKGYHWGKFKKAMEKTVTIVHGSGNKKIQIPDEIEEDSIYFNLPKSFGWNLLKSLRHAFAHNYIFYDEATNMVTVKLPAYRKNDGTLKLHCKMSFANFKKMVNALIDTKSKTR